MPVTGFDHVSFPAGDPEAILAFYKRLGFSTVHEEEWRRGDYPLFAIAIGEDAKLNFHGPAMWQNPEFETKGPTAKPGCGDFCFVFDGTIEEATQLIKDAGGEVAYGPMDQPGGGEKASAGATRSSINTVSSKIR
jgi:catechol 2,3-dioxygenase-like lactoylglutathione lyase family enzyme